MQVSDHIDEADSSEPSRSTQAVGREHGSEQGIAQARVSQERAGTRAQDWARQLRAQRPAGTTMWDSPRARKWLAFMGLASLVGIGFTVWLGLWVTPPDVNMGQLVRLVYIHPPVAWVAYLAFGVTALASLLYLWPRTRSQALDKVAGASGELGVLFCALTIATGSIWGRPTWGVWWTWDARLTSTALLLLLFIGYLALRKVPGNPHTVARRSAIAALVAFADVPIDHFSVDWWHTLHQRSTVELATFDIKIYGIMAWTLALGFLAFTLAYVWLLIQRYRIEVLKGASQRAELEAALVERRREDVDQVEQIMAASSVPVGSGRS